MIRFRNLKRLAFVCFVFWGVQSSANLLVMEYRGEEHGDEHGVAVSDIACRESRSSCETHYFSEFSQETIEERVARLLLSFEVVNMSFNVQSPGEMPEIPPRERGTEKHREAIRKYQEAVATYQRESANLRGLITSYPEHLFVASAGNGRLIGPFYTTGIGIDGQTEMYPQAMITSNLVKVASILSTAFDIQNPQDYQLADYSNYSLEYVDVAAPVELNRDGEVQQGTSFSCPYTSRVMDRVKTRFPSLNGVELKQILLRSCHIKDVSRALWATRDLRRNGENSVVYQAMFERNEAERDRLRNEVLGDITLVRCGGVVSEKLAMSCAEGFLADGRADVTEACLRAHAEWNPGAGEESLAALRILWQERGLSAPEML